MVSESRFHTGKNGVCVGCVNLWFTDNLPKTGSCTTNTKSPGFEINVYITFNYCIKTNDLHFLDLRVGNDL